MLNRNLASIIYEASSFFVGSHYSNSSLINQTIHFQQIRFVRRTLKEPPWIPPTYKPIYRELTKTDREYVEEALKRDQKWQRKSNSWQAQPMFPELDVPDCTKNKYSRESSKRIGLIGRKIGMLPQWWKDGTRVLCTLIHIPDNHVLTALDPDEWYRRSPTGKLKAFGRNGPHWSQMVGALDENNPFYTDAYRRLFERVGVPVKKKVSSFLVTEDAIVKPGTKLDVRHFSIGQYVTVSGKSVDWGFQGAMHRWGFKGMPTHGTTKSHRRLGSTGSKSDAKVWPGKRMHGHMGYAWSHTHGLQIVRINPIKQVLYVVGCTPGDNGEWLLIKDTMMEKKRPLEPPFPTYYTDVENDFTKEQKETELQHKDQRQYEPSELNAIYAVTSQDLFHPNIFQFSHPSIVYTEADETKSAIRDKTHAKTAKIRK